MAKVKMLRLGQFIEDPDNVSEATDDEIKRLAGKLRRVPQGLKANRIAYVTDDPSGKWKVISGNKRLRVLKAAYGDDGEVPADWFQDITEMSEAQRHEFRVTANINDGHFNIDKLLAQYERPMLDYLGLDKLLADVAAPVMDSDQYGTSFQLADGDKSEIVTVTFTLHQRQLDAVKMAMAAVADGCGETFGNTNKNGNALYEVVRQWLANR